MANWTRKQRTSKKKRNVTTTHSRHRLCNAIGPISSSRQDVIAQHLIYAARIHLSVYRDVIIERVRICLCMQTSRATDQQFPIRKDDVSGPESERLVPRATGGMLVHIQNPIWVWFHVEAVLVYTENETGILYGLTNEHELMHNVPFHPSPMRRAWSTERSQPSGRRAHVWLQ